MAKIDRKTLQQLRKIAPPFFTSELKWRAIGLLLLLATFSISISGVNVMMSYIGRDFMTALSLKEKDEFFRQLYLYLVAFACATPIVVFYRYTEERLGLLWRKWLSRNILGKYFANRAYYKINILGGIDNPDQRIEEDIRSFTNTSLSFLLIIFNSIIQLFAFMGILWSISGYLTFTVVGYATLGSIITYYLGRPLIGLNFAQLKKEADYRYKLVNVRDNAESIAFLGDEEKEFTRTRQRLKIALANLLNIINWNRNLNFFTTGYNYLVTILPTIIVAPLYLNNQIEFGVVTQAGFAFSQALGALSIVVLNFGSLSALAAAINRLGSFWDELELAEKSRLSDAQKIQTEDGSSLVFKDVTIITPKRDQVLIRNLNFECQAKGLLITGASGSGKSSILRTIAGLWNYGEGKIIRPSLTNAMFLPQRPYMVLGSFRNQMLYAIHQRGASDKQLMAALEQVGLEETLSRVGGFDANLDWNSILSSGEQQKLAFARLLLVKPTFAILDEATTALDSQTEERLYKLVAEISPLFISVGYRTTLEKFHNSILTLDLGGKWKYENAK